MIQEILDDRYGGGGGGGVGTTIAVIDGGGSYDDSHSRYATNPLEQVLVKKPYESEISQVSEDMELPVPETPILFGKPDVISIQPVEAPIAETPVSTPIEAPVQNLGSSIVNPNPIDIVPPKVETQPAVVPIAVISKPIEIPVENLGSSIVNPRPIDTLPVKVPVAQVVESTSTATPIIDVPVVAPIQKEAVTVPKEETTSNIASAPVDTVAKAPLSIIPLTMPNLGSAVKSGSEEILNKKNPTYWLYVLAGALVIGYFLTKTKTTEN